MKARYKGENTKKITVAGETLEFPSGQWIVLPSIAFLNRLKQHKGVFDIVYDYDIRPFLKFGTFIWFGNRTIHCAHKPTIRALDSMKSLTRQATLPETGEVIFRVNSYSETYLQGFVSLKSQVSVLCYRTKGGIGDIIMTFPVMEAIAKKYPNYKIDFACPSEFVELAENIPFINQAFRFQDIDQQVYDIAYDMTRKCIQYEGRTQPDVDLNRTEIFANAVDISPDKLPRTKLFLSPEEVERAVCIDFVKTAENQRLVRRSRPSNNQLVIGICFESSAKVRSFYYPEELLKGIAKTYPEAIILLFQKEMKVVVSDPNVYYITDFSFRDIIMLISRCDFFFGPDTGLSHVASALRVKTLWFFSHIDGKIRTKGYDTSEVAQVTPPACPLSKPCWYLFPCDPNERGETLDGAHCQISHLPASVMQAVGSILSTPCVSIIVLCHNRFDLTKDCIQRLLRIKKYNDELILVDNGSEDETQKYFSNLNIHGFRYFRMEQNLGCVSGRNFAMKQARGKFIWLLDNDQFIEDYSLQKIMETEGDFVGVEGWFIKEDGMATRYSKCGMLNYVGAGGMFAKRETFEDVDYFDETYNPAWFEDPDICFKATEQGYSLGLCENANIEHLAHSTNRSQFTFNSPKTWIRNRKYFVNKWKHTRIGKPIVSIVILTHNDSDTTIRCLRSIYQNTDMKHFEAIVVDNGSNEKEVDKLHQFVRPNLQYIFNQDNLMVAAGRNIGAKSATGEFILFLDNDMIVPENWLQQILGNIDKYTCAATAPQVVDIKEGREHLRFMATVVKDGAIYEIKEKGVYQCDFLPGGALFVNRKVFEEYPFDEKFIFGVEDYDWCMKLREDGYSFVNTPDVVFLHAKTTKERTVTPYDDAERERKGSSYIEDSIRLFLFRYNKQLPDQWKQPGWLQWAVGRNNQIYVKSLPELLVMIYDEIATLYPDEVITERTGFNEDIGVELGRRC